MPIASLPTTKGEELAGTSAKGNGHHKDTKKKSGLTFVPPWDSPKKEIELKNFFNKRLHLVSLKMPKKKKKNKRGEINQQNTS